MLDDEALEAAAALELAEEALLEDALLATDEELLEEARLLEELLELLALAEIRRCNSVILFWSSVVQSSRRIPPVSPLLGFQAQ